MRIPKAIAATAAYDRQEPEPVYSAAETKRGMERILTLRMGMSRNEARAKIRRIENAVSHVPADDGPTEAALASLLTSIKAATPGGIKV